MLNLYRITFTRRGETSMVTTTVVKATGIIEACDSFLQDRKGVDEIIEAKRVRYGQGSISSIADKGLQAAIKAIQTELGITTGDNAAQWWQGSPEKDVMQILEAYVLHEIRTATPPQPFAGDDDAEQ